MHDENRQLDLFLDYLPRVLRQRGICANTAFETMYRGEHICAFDIDRINALKNAIGRAWHS